MTTERAYHDAAQLGKKLRSYETWRFQMIQFSSQSRGSRTMGSPRTQDMKKWSRVRLWITRTRQHLLEKTESHEVRTRNPPAGL